MEDLTQFSDGLGFEVLASSLRADLTDTHAFLNALAEKLGGSLPQQCVVERKGGLFAKEKPVHKITIELGEYRYFIEKASHGGLHGGRIKVVRGIALKTEELPIDQWIDALSRDLAAFAARNSQARAALDRLLT